MILELDCGNSRLKWRLVETDGAAAVLAGALPWNSGGCLAHIAAEIEEAGKRAERVRLANVGGAEREQKIAQWSSSCWGCLPQVARTAAKAGMLRNAYIEPASLGVDRWLGMIAARQRCTGAFAVADCGSALTVDLVAADGCHLGGYIGPGYRGGLIALDAGTAGIQEEPLPPEGIAPGRATGPAMRAGTLLMLAGMLERVRAHLPQEEAPLFLSGGDAPLLRPHLRGWTPVVDAPELVLDGLRHLVP